jgi:GNAT superfamily N-acetyltransferase
MADIDAKRITGKVLIKVAVETPSHASRLAKRLRLVGRALLDCAKQYARDAGAAELQIGVLSQNTAARVLYLHEGFAPYKETLSKPLR